MKYKTHYSQTTCRHYPTILLIFYSIQSPVQEARTELATWTNTPAQVFEWKFITEVYVYIISVVRRIKRFFFSSFPPLLKLTMVVVTFAAYFSQILGSRGLPVPSQAFLAYVFSILQSFPDSRTILDEKLLERDLGHTFGRRYRYVPLCYVLAVRKNSEYPRLGHDTHFSNHPLHPGHIDPNHVVALNSTA